MMVEEFRQILLWPIALSKKGSALNEASAEMVNELAVAVSSDPHWARVEDGLAHIDDDLDTPKLDGEYSPHAYQEFVYFQDFVARFLYANQEDDALEGRRPMQAFHLFRHRTLRRVSIIAHSADLLKQIDLHVARGNLYLFRTGIAILALEVSSKDPRSENPIVTPISLPSNDTAYEHDDLHRPFWIRLASAKVAPRSARYPPLQKLKTGLPWCPLRYSRREDHRNNHG